MELVVARGRATPDELEAVIVAITRYVAGRADTAAATWSDPARSLRGPLPAVGRDGWRLSGWTG